MAKVVLFEGEPEAGPWRISSMEDVRDDVLSAGAAETRRPRIVAIDGCGGAGKSTVAHRMQRVTPRSAVVHTDDIAWHHSLFDWAQVLMAGVLIPARNGRAVSFRPPAWEARGRNGAICVPSESDVVWLEGTGAAQTELFALVDAAIWVQADRLLASRRCIDREGGGSAATERSAAWQTAETAFFARERPWERCQTILAGAGASSHDVIREAIVAPGPLLPDSKPSV